MKRKKVVFFVCIIMVIILSCLLIGFLLLNKSEYSELGRDIKFKLNFENYWANGSTNAIDLNSLTVGKWSTMYLNNQYGPVFKVDSTHVLMIRGSGYTRRIYYLLINDDNKSASSVKNTTFTYGTVTYKSDSEACVYRSDGGTYCVFGDYAILFLSAQSRYLRCGEWVGGTSNWKHYDVWGLTNSSVANRDNGFPLTEVPDTFYSIPVNSSTHIGEHEMNGVTRVIKKVGVNDENASILNHPFVFNVTDDTTYRFWVDSTTRTTVPNTYVYDSVEEHLIWPEYNKAITGDNYTSGNVGADINNVGTYVVNGKKVDVNLRLTFYWQTSPVKLAYKMENAYNHKTGTTTTFTFNQFPRFVGLKVSNQGHRLGLPITGTPYRTKIDFFYVDENGEHTLDVNGSFGFEDIDGHNYIAIKADSGATIDEVQCIENNYAWECDSFGGNGSINTLSLGLNANDNSGVYDVICTNNVTNAPNVHTSASSEYMSERPNYVTLTSNNGFESRIIYNISNLSQMNVIVGGYGQHEYGKRYFNSIFDLPNVFTQIIANEKNNIYNNYAVEYAKKDSTRDVNTNTFQSMGCINISGVQLGRNAIPTPTVMLKDANENEGENIEINRNEAGTLNTYTEMVRIKIPYEENYSISQNNYDNYYDSFKIEQQLDEGISLDLTDNRAVNIHYLGNTTNLAEEYFTISVNSENKLEIKAKSEIENKIYKQQEFYECELVIEIPLAITNDYTNNSIWNSSVKEFNHAVTLVVGRNNSEYTTYDPEAIEVVSKESDSPAIAKVYVVTLGINRDDETWTLSSGSTTNEMVKAALYSNNVEEYSFSDGVAINSNSAIRWVGVENKTYNIYASKNNDEKDILVDTGKTINLDNTQ